MLNTGRSRGGSSFRKRLHRIIQNTTLLPSGLNKLQDWLFTDQARSTELVLHTDAKWYLQVYTQVLCCPRPAVERKREKGEKLLTLNERTINDLQ